MKRKGYGSGSVFPETREGVPTGRWVAMWEMPPENGRRKRGHRVRDTEAAAWKAMADARGKPSSRSRRSTESVGAYLDRWLADVVARTRRERTLVGYRAIVDRAVGSPLGTMGLADRRLGHEIQAFLNGLDRHPTTVHHYAACLKAAFGYAVRKGLMDRNPAADLDLPAVPKVDRIPLTAAQLRTLLDYTGGRDDSRGRRGAGGSAASFGAGTVGESDAAAVGEGGTVGPGRGTGLAPRTAVDPLHPLYVTAAWTGLRQGELLGLRWQDVDLDRASLVVRSSLTRRLASAEGARYVLTEPKTERSRRTVPLLPEVVAVLRELRKEQLATPGKLDQGLVFCTPAGSPLDGTDVTKAFQRALAAAGLPRVTFHSMRHGAASLLLELGVDIATVSRSMGHANIATTVDLYGHISPAHVRSAFDRLGEAVG